MSRKPNESSLEFRRRMMDPISTSFCAAKWLNATIWLGHGQTASCHHPPPHRISTEEIQKNPRALHNTLHKKLMRAQMLRGERPKECEYCWKIENMSTEAVSDRVFKSDFYDDADLEKAGKSRWDADSALRTLEIAFDRVCNFACSYCNAGYSTRWAQDIKKHGAYHLQSDGGGAFQHDGAWSEAVPAGETNPFVEAFWQWLPELTETLLELKVTGGEPLQSPHFWKFLDFFEQRPPRKELLVSVNSNLGSRPELISKLIQKTKHWPQFGLYTSGEAVGAQAEYIRDGLDYDLFRANIETLLEARYLKRLQMMVTVNALCLYSLTEFMDTLIEWKSRYGVFMPAFSLTILRFPSFMSASTLPFPLREERANHLRRWLRSRDRFLLAPEIETVQRLIDYLLEVEAPHRQSSSLESRQRDFKSFYVQYDRRRGKNFRATFPRELVDWYDALPDPKGLDERRPLISGDASDNHHDPLELERLLKRENASKTP